MAKALADQARMDAKETAEALKMAKSTTHSGTENATEEELKKMAFTPDRHAGVWGNEDLYQNAMEAYTSHLGKHPVWGPEALETQYPSVKGQRLVYQQKTWWPQGPTHLAQFCKCNEKKETAQYKKPKVRRNHCPDCGHFKSKNETEYDWDPVVDDKKGKPDLGDVFVQRHIVTGVHFDRSHKNGGNLSKIQLQAGSGRQLGANGQLGESYNANIDCRQIDTSAPDGPASIRQAERNNDLDAQLLAKKKADLRSKMRPKTESQIRNASRSEADKANRLQADISSYNWGVGEAYPYGERDKPSTIVEGPARDRHDKKRKVKEELMKQPHSKLDRPAYTSGNVLEELDEEQKSGRISKALLYYELVSQGRTKVLKEVMDQDENDNKKNKEEENKLFNERRKARLEKEAAKKASIMAAGNSAKAGAGTRSMSKTTFNQKSLHSGKHQDKIEKDVKKRNKKLNKLIKRGSKIHLGDGDGDGDGDEGGESKEEKKKRRKKRKKILADDGEDEGDGEFDEKEKGKDKRDKKRAEKKRSKSSSRVVAKTSSESAAAPSAVRIVDSDEDEDEEGGGLTNLAEQQRLYQEKLDKENAEIKEAKRLKEEEVEKAKLLAEAKRNMVQDKDEKGGKKKSRRASAVAVAGGEGGEGGVVEGEEEGQLDANNDQLAEPQIELGDDGNPVVPIASKESVEAQALQTERKRNRDILVKKIIATFWFFVKILEQPLLLIPPYKRFKAKLAARRILRENGASKLNNNKYDNVLQHIFEVVRIIVMEKLALLHVLLFMAYMELTRCWNRRHRVFTIDDLEGGAFDGDNQLVVKCVAQRLGSRQKPLDVNGRTPEGKTPLQCCFEGLLKADNGESQSAFKTVKQPTLAEMTGISRIGKLLGVIDDPITKYNKTLATLLSMKADIHTSQDGEQSEGHALIHLAALAGNTKRIAWLLAKGVDIHKTTFQHQWTPLHCACMAGKAEAAMMLLTKGSIIDQRDKDGAAALHLAAKRGGTHITRMLLLCGAKKSIWNNNGETPFNYAVKAGRKSTVESLLVYRPSTLGSKQSINFLFAKMMDEGEFLEGDSPKKKIVATKTTKVASTAASMLSTGLTNLFKKAANTVMVANGGDKSVGANQVASEFDRYK